MTTAMRLTLPTALVLQAVHRGFRHGFDIMDASGLSSGTVYPILRRLESTGMLRARWESVADARDAQRPPRRYYELTAAGSRALAGAKERFPGIAHALAPGASPAT